MRERLDHALKAVKDPERLAKVKSIADQFEIYPKDFDKVVPMQREHAKLVKEVLDPTGEKLRIDLQRLQKNAAVQAGNSNTVMLAGEAIKLLMQVRLNADKALVRHDESFVKAAETAFAQRKRVLVSFEAQIVKFRTCVSSSTTSRSNTDKFHDAFVKSMHELQTKFPHSWMARCARWPGQSPPRQRRSSRERDSRRAQDRA